MEQTIPVALASLARRRVRSIDAAPPVAHPAGFRDRHHVTTSIVQPGHPLYAAGGGIDPIHANALAAKGYASGTFPDGSMLVFDTIEAKKPTMRSRRVPASCSA